MLKSFNFSSVVTVWQQWDNSKFFTVIMKAFYSTLTVKSYRISLYLTALTIINLDMDFETFVSVENDLLKSSSGKSNETLALSNSGVSSG